VEERRWGPSEGRNVKVFQLIIKISSSDPDKFILESRRSNEFISVSFLQILFKT